MNPSYSSRSFPQCAAEELEIAALAKFEREPSGAHIQPSGSRLLITPHHFSSNDEAESWLMTNTDPEDPLLAVKFFLPPVGFSTAAIDDSISALSEEWNKQQDALTSKYDEYSGRDKPLRQIFLERVTSEKSGSSICSKCKTPIPHAYLKTYDCPVCGKPDFFLTDEDNKIINDAMATSTELDEKCWALICERKNLIISSSLADSNKDNWAWRVGGYFVSNDHESD